VAGGGRSGVNETELLKDLRKQVVLLENDLRARSEDPEEPNKAELEAEYQRARKAKRTAATYEAWRDERITQVAAAWVLGTVFVRFCEDNGLIEDPWIAGPGERLAYAEERQGAFFHANPNRNDRDWLIATFEHLASTNQTVAGLFDRKHNPLWEILPSYEAAGELLSFWRRRGGDGEIVHDFTTPEGEPWDTRFLGDLYQGLSEHARKTYALLQTPEFVEEFILDLTLEPAIEEFGLEPVVEIRNAEGVIRELHGLRTIDPACGSGHFLLGIFARLVAKWEAAAPGLDRWEIIRRSLESVHGCDKNPFAVAIARFRLLVAALQAVGETRLCCAPVLPINVAVGDSLLHGRGAESVTDDLFSSERELFSYTTEDIAEFSARIDLLGRNTYHTVVGNPPYITVKDKQENENYRKAYDACSGTYALSIPFAQRIFELAIRGSGADSAAGFAGQITANSFMKREFGKKLIEQFFPMVDLIYVIDTSGAYIPGHGTPTVILVGRNRFPVGTATVRTVFGVRGEPSRPENPTVAVVWRTIVEQIAKPGGSESEWVSTKDVDRRVFDVFPWSLSGGGAIELASLIEKNGTPLGNRVSSIGRTTATGADDAYFLPDAQTALRTGDVHAVRELVAGDSVRDFSIRRVVSVRNPYSTRSNDRPIESTDHLVAVSLWPHRILLSSRMIFGKTITESGVPWYCHLENYSSKLRNLVGISFAFVATHNHFVLDWTGKIFNRTAPVIKLPEGASEADHLALLGVLNSSTACFWLKQVSQSKGNGGIGGGISDELWEHRYEFTGTKLQDFPLPATLPLDLGRTLDAHAQRLAAHEPSAVISATPTTMPTRAALKAAQATHASIRARMIAAQEELDWQVYHSYGLLSDAELAATAAPDLSTVPEIALGERAFEIVLARKKAAGEIETAWFSRHNSTPITEIPAHWPAEYRRIVQARIDLIEKRRDLALIERPECKRRWAATPWAKKEEQALRSHLLDLTEDESLWYGLRDGYRQPRTLTTTQLADALRSNEAVTATAALLAADHFGKPDMPLTAVLAQVLVDQHVPHLAALRYKDSGLRKRAQWEQVWEMQREEDRTGERLDIPVPPKYASADFLKASYWSHRGKLDVPKERFVSYPGASPDADADTLLLGWAGWNHADQAQALINLINDRSNNDGWGTDRIVPLLAGLQEMLPWVQQWHGEYDPEWEEAPADAVRLFLDNECAQRGLSHADLAAWRPAPAARGRRPKAGAVGA
jgi:hypothetical protein